MAAAEARAVWQRVVNRCFVQEDAKRAPKLACCQSSSSSSSSSSASNKQVDSVSGGAPDPQDQPSPCFMPLNQSHRFSDHSSGTRWWVHIQPGYANEKEPLKDQMRPLEAEINLPGEGFHQESASCKEHNLGTTAFTCDNCFQEHIELVETRESYGFVGLEDNVGFVSNESLKRLNELSLDMGSPWNLSREKAESWWRSTDKDELASFVAQKSLDYVENCDLPTPQKMHKGKYSCGSPSLDRQRAAAREKHDQPGSDRSLGCSHNTSSSLKDRTERRWRGSGLSKAELLEALRHSQTRAREAEKEVKEAYEEKEQLVKLVHKQASQIFGYKQWLQLLQLEALYLQIKKKTADPPFLNPRRRKWSEDKTGKRAKQNRGVTKLTFAFAVALGLSLVGAGLLLGWTVGWMLPF